MREANRVTSWPWLVLLGVVAAAWNPCLGDPVFEGPARILASADINTGEDQPAPPATCELEVCCYDVPFDGSPAWHCFSKCTKPDPDGGPPKATACWGGPTGLFWDRWPKKASLPKAIKPHCPGWSIFSGAWGTGGVVLRDIRSGQSASS